MKDLYNVKEKIKQIMVITREKIVRKNRVETSQRIRVRLLGTLKETVDWVKFRGRSISWKSPAFFGITTFFLVAVIAGTVYLNETVSATYLVLNGQRLGLVASEKAGNDLLSNVLDKSGNGLGIAAKTHDRIEFQTVRVKKVVWVEQQLKPKDLEAKLNTYVDGWEIKADGQRLVVLPRKEDAEKVLTDYENYYAKPGPDNQVTSVSLNEHVEINPVEVDVNEVQSPDKALSTLEAGKTTTKDYVVQQNDSWWLIARKNDMKTKEVLAGNPGATEDTVLQPGQVIKLVSITPYLTVLSKGTYTATEIIPFDVVSKTDYNLGSGQTVVKQQGSDGSKIVTYFYERKNGHDVSKTVVTQKVVKEAVPQVVAKGPDADRVTIAYASRGSGSVPSLMWPIRGRINSYYGMRWGSFHTGIDIAGDTGDPYVAAAAGKVVAAGWDGGYGKMILIDHGNGVMTRYAHSSTLLVSVGQQVTKGQTIGLVGSTGNTTGPHLHFEIISNGSTLNPLSYLP